MNPQALQQIQTQMQAMQSQIDALKTQLNFKNSVDVGTIRDTIFPRTDAKQTTPLTQAILVAAGGGTIYVPNAYTGYFETYYRGKLVRVPYV